MGQVVQTSDRHNYLSKLLGYDYEIKYKPGKDNKTAASLSHLHMPSDSHLLVFLVVSFDFLNHVKYKNHNYWGYADIKTRDTF